MTAVKRTAARPRGVLGRRQTRVGLALIVAGISLVIFVSVRAAPNGGGWRNPLSSALAIALLVAILAQTTKVQRLGVGDVRSPSALTIGLSYVIIGVILPATAIAVGGLDIEDRLLLPDLHRPAAAVWLWCLGFSFAFAAYAMVIARPVPRFRLNHRQVVAARLETAFVIGLIVSIVNRLARGRSIDGRADLPALLAPFEQVIGYGQSLALLAIAGLASLPQRRYHLTARVMVVAAAALGFSEGFFKPSVWAILAYVLGRGLSPNVATSGTKTTSRWRKTVRVLGAAGLVIVIIPMVQASRGVNEAPSGDTSLRSAYSASWGSGFTTGWNSFTTKALGRQASVLAGTGRAVDRVPNPVPFRGLDEMLLVPTYSIPRAVWPSKPSLSTGVEVSIEFFDHPASTRSSSSLTTFGDAYWYSGLRSLILAGILVGGVMGLMDAGLRSRAAAVCRIAVLPLVVDFDTSFAQWIVGAVQGLVVVYLMALAVSRSIRS